MGLFGFFSSAPFEHASLGRFERSGNVWSGSIALGGGTPIDLDLVGSKERPGAAELALAEGLKSRYAKLKSAIEVALHEHYGSYRDAFDAGELELDAGTFPRISSAAQVWPHVAPIGVNIGPLDGSKPIVEIRYETAWDIEHVVGARFSEAWELVELCGSA